MSGAPSNGDRFVRLPGSRGEHAAGGGRCVLPFLLLLAFAAAGAGAGEIYSNGTGGGLWSEPGSWRTKAVPGPEDTAVISAGDTVVFDRDDGDRITCRDLALDPGGALTFEPGGRRIMVVAGPVEAYGTIRLDATGSAADLYEIRLTGETDEKRVIRLQEDGALMAYGRPGLPDGGRNVVLACRPPTPVGSESPGMVEANDGSSLDLQRVRVEDLRVQATGLDNTGGQANERMNVSDCRFEGVAMVHVSGCDTPTIVNNSFRYDGATILVGNAISALNSPLAEIRGNTVSGGFAWGIVGQAQTDSTVQGNTLEKCTGGTFWNGANAIIKGNTIRSCSPGVHCAKMSGLLEDNTLDGCKIGIDVAGGTTIQVTGLTIANLPQDGLPIDLKHGQLTLVNTDLVPGQVKIGGPKPTEGAWVETLQYLVVGIKGKVPAGVEVEVVTRNPARPPASGAADLNVRNSPAPVTARGSTPLPASLRPLIVRGWAVGADGTLEPEPEYVVRLLAPPDPAVADAPRKTLAEIVVKPAPAWYRPAPADATPTVEIEVP
jgi:hypothetical protein